MASIDSLNEYTFKWCKSIKEIDRKDWETIFGDSLIKSYSIFLAMEDSDFQSVKYCYLLISKGSMIASIIPCFSYNLDLLNLITSSKLKHIIKKTRLIFPSLFMLKTFITGSYIATCEHFIEYNKILNKDEINNINYLLNQQLKIGYRNTSSQLILIKDIRERSLSFLKKELDKDFHFFISFPTTVIPVFTGDLPYPQGLKKKNRKRYRIYKDKFDANFEWEIISDFKDYIPLLTELYENVYEKAKNKFELLNSTFFYNINNKFPLNSFLLIAKDKIGEIRLMEIVLEERDRLLPLYLGINYKNDDTKVLYLNAIFKTVEEAERRDKKLVDFGQTSYYPKVMSGALVENIYYGFWSDNFFMKKIIQNIFPKMFNAPHILENVYLDIYKEKVCQLLEKKGFYLLNK